MPLLFAIDFSNKLFFSSYFFILIFTFSIVLNIKKNSNNELLILFLSTLVLKLFFVFKSPLLSDDIYRYLWEAKVFLKGFNPYIVPPESERLISFRDLIYQYINHKNLPAIYPPIMLYIDSIVVNISYSLKFYKLFLFVIDIANFVIIILILSKLKQPLRFSLYYFIHPLTFIEVEWSGHNDVVMIFFILLAILFYLNKKFFISKVSFLCSVFFKFIYLIFVRDFVKSKKDILLILFFIILVYFPFLNDLSFYSLNIYLKTWEFNGSVYKILSYFIENKFYVRIILAGLYFMFWITINCHIKEAFKRFLALIVCFILILPTVHPWYGLWILPFLCFEFSISIYIFLLLLPFSYEILENYIKFGLWQENLIVNFLIYIIPGLIFIGEHSFLQANKGLRR